MKQPSARTTIHIKNSGKLKFLKKHSNVTGDASNDRNLATVQQNDTVTYATIAGRIYLMSLPEKDLGSNAWPLRGEGEKLLCLATAVPNHNR